MNISQFLIKLTSNEDQRHNYSGQILKFYKPKGYTFASSIRKFEVESITGNTVRDIQTLLTDEPKNISEINNFVLDNYCILNFIGLASDLPSKSLDISAINSLEQIQSKIEDYLNAPNDREIKIDIFYNYRFKFILDNFTGSFRLPLYSTWYRIPTIYFSCQVEKLSGTNIIIENGNIYYCGKTTYPLVSLMVEDDYVDEFKIRTILNLPLDYSKFRYWIDSSIFGLRETAPADCRRILKLLGSIDNKIKIEFKDNLSVSFVDFPLPQFNTILDRKLWLNSIKNGYINNKYGKNLPFNKMQVIKKTVEDPDPKLLSHKSYKRFLNKQLENKYELIS